MTAPHVALRRWQVTHIGIHGRRRRLCVVAQGNRQAMAWAEQLLGEARYMACVREDALRLRRQAAGHTARGDARHG